MKNFFKSIFLGGLFVFFIASPVMMVASAPVASAAASCEQRLLGIPPWYRGLTNDDCSLVPPEDVGGIENYIWRIVLNGIEMALVAVVYIAVFFIIFGGFLYITGGASPGQIEKAKKTLTNAIVGLVIALSAIAINNLIFSLIT